MRLSALLLAISLLAGCSESKQEAAQAVDSAVVAATEAVAGTAKQATDVQEAAAPKATASVLAVREAVAAIPSVKPPEVPTQRNIDPAVVALVVRWEVGSQKQYTAKYQGVICPGGASGPTIGIGDDLGHQTPAEIRRRWGWHPLADEMATGSGQTGPAACNAWRKAHPNIRVSYDDAIRVFTTFAWPKYMAMASRAYRNGWMALSGPHKDALGSNGYNRGFAMVGTRNTEKRHTRDVCVPANDPGCTATQLRASCRIWQGTSLYKGLCARRHAEADYAVRPA